jgi:hypothetical protein
MENEITLPSLRDAVATPTPWDGIDNFTGTLPEPGWGLLLTRSRDADIATESNWAAAVKELGDSEDVDVIRIGHWAVGWIEFLGVREGTETYDKAVEIRNALSDYPLLDEEDFSEREHDAAIDLWQNVFSTQDRIDYIRRHRSQFEVDTFADLLANARGTTFSGYASELLN